MNKVGKFGEDIACVFLEKHGYKILERNYLRKWGELDIIAKKAKKLCFVEVKTVSCGTSAGIGYRPEDNMSSSKIKRFTRIIQTYLQEKDVDHAEWSAALIAIRVDTVKKIAKVRFIENLILQ
jgi:putative endonuclease